MKKVLRFTALMCPLLMLAPIVSASELVVVKQYKTTYVLEIENYKGQDMYVLATPIDNARINDPLIRKLPKEAQNIAIRKEDGMFNTITNRLEAKINSLEKENAKLRKANSDKNEAGDFAIFLLIIAGVVISIEVIFSIISRKNNLQKETEARKKIPS